MQEHGVAKFGRLIDQNIEQARHLCRRIEVEPRLELLAPGALNIVCFRYNPGQLDEQRIKRINIEIMVRMQETGVAAVSDTTLRGRHCLRAAICNHRTRRADLDRLVKEVLALGDDISPQDRA